jgi:hypothetical protein
VTLAHFPWAKKCRRPGHRSRNHQVRRQTSREVTSSDPVKRRATGHLLSPTTHSCRQCLRRRFAPGLFSRGLFLPKCHSGPKAKCRLRSDCLRILASYSGIPIPTSAPARPPTAPPTPAPARAATIGPAAMKGPTPGIANEPIPTSQPRIPPSTAPDPAPAVAPSLCSQSFLTLTLTSVLPSSRSLRSRRPRLPPPLPQSRLFPLRISPGLSTSQFRPSQSP